MNFFFYQRHSLAHNLAQIYEGTTVSRANDASKLGPFIPFSYDSEGGISSMMFLSDVDQIRGDVIIDCGFTKLFTELTTDGTLRYVQNIAALTAQYQKHYQQLGANGPKGYRPPSFTQQIDETVKKQVFMSRCPFGPFDILYLVDGTGSMMGTIEAAKRECVSISEELTQILSSFDFQFGAIFYRDPIDSPCDVHDRFPLTNDVEGLKAEMRAVRATGGGDGPEDWVGAYKEALDNLNWRNGHRLIIHIADYPAHGQLYCGSENHQEEEPKLAPLIERCSAQGIRIVAMPIGPYAQQSFDRCRKIYQSAGGLLYEIKPFGSSDVSALFKDMIIQAVVCAAPKK
jgi:hypothetical protein